MPIKLDFRTRSAQHCFFWSNRNCAIQSAHLISVTMQKIIAGRDLLENVRVLRIELGCALEIFGRFSPASLSSVDIASQHKRPRIVR